MSLHRTAVATLVLLALALPGRADPPNPPTPLQKAAQLFKDEHWAEARAAYDEARDAEKDWHSPVVREAVEGAVAASLKLQRWDDALARAQEYIAKTSGSLEAAKGERFLAGLLLQMPHQGTKSGGTFRRGEYGQGVYVSSWRKDRREAIAHYERARQLLIALAGQGKTEAPPATINAERIGVDFDLAAALAQPSNSRYGFGRWGWWDWWWGDAEDEEDSEAVEEADYEEMRNYWGGWNQEQETPVGIPLGPDGKPRFPTTPAAYAPELGAGSKIRFLLQEIQQLDLSEKKTDAAKALLRQAMIAKTLYGPDSAAQWQGTRVRTDRLGRPLPAETDEAPAKKVWELADDEALTPVGGRLQVVALPLSESPVALLRLLEEKYPGSGLKPEAHYARALYFQSRQQFPRALEEYRALIERYAQHQRANDAKAQIEAIEKPGVALGQSGVYLPDQKPRLTFNYRNTGALEFKAIRVDLAKYVRDQMEDTDVSYWQYRNLSSNFFSGVWRRTKDGQTTNDPDAWKKYLGAEAAQWRESVPNPPGHRAGEGSTLAPLTEPGAYVVEARTPGATEPSRALVLVTDIAIVQKALVGKGLIWLADARTGQPLPDRAVRVYEHWDTYDNGKSERHWDSTVLTTDKNGVIEYAAKHYQVDAVVLGENRRLAFSFFQNWAVNSTENYWQNGPRHYVITDRPVYRPGATVKFRVWLRDVNDRQMAAPQAGQSVQLEIYDPRNAVVKTLAATTDALGGADGEFTLGEEPPLGVYHIQVNSQRPDGYHNAGGLFRVEEYKKPEFEVTVAPAKTTARLGEKVKARIEARYYFGAPVKQGRVSYKVFRENYSPVYWEPSRYDWLYGPGYGRYRYAYPWLPWWGRWGCLVPGPWWYGIGYGYGGYGNPYDDVYNGRRRAESGTRKALRELVAQGEATLKADGTIEVDIDTSRADRNHDHRYTVEAEVRDASRRTITGEGSVIVTRQEFFAFVETDGGWYQRQNEAFVTVRTLTADNVPVSARGEVTVSRIRYSGAGNNKVNEEVVWRKEATTDAEGRFAVKYPVPGAGQYRVTFKARDSQKAEVQGNAVFWVGGPGFDGRVYRFNDLEIVADKRTYQVGDTAHLLVNTAEDNARVLFSDDAGNGALRSYRFLDIAARSTVIDVPVTARQVPNFFVEATLVRNGRVHTEAQQLFVPPVRGLLNVEVKTDKATYKAGETGRVRVAVTDANGEPVRGQVTLTAYDRAVTYIQDEFGPSPRVFYYGRQYQHTPQNSNSTDQSFSPMGYLHHPENEIWGTTAPEGWSGSWGLEGDGLTLRMNGPTGAAGATGPAAQPMSGAGGGGFGGGLGDRAASRHTFAIDADSRSDALSSLAKAKGDKGEAGQPSLVEPEIRANFADTALWLPSLLLDANGKAETEITFPQSLTTWRLHGYALTDKTQVGDATAQAVTTKNLLVRLQAPRFFIERDEVVLSANVHNYLKTAKAVRAELIVPAGLFSPLLSKEGPGEVQPDKDGNLHLLAQAKVPADGETRFDWPVKAKQAGLARITVKALTDEESDGMRLAFPVLVHGINKTVAQSGSYRVAQDGTRTLTLDLPAQIDPEQTRLEVTLSPSLAGVMVDALPYLAGYPYGCTEQTMSRFYPAVLVKQTLKKLGTDLETIAKQRRQMNEADLKNRFGRYPYNESPVFDSATLDDMVHAGLTRLYTFQHSDGGWGWWQNDDSSVFQTAYVLQGLHAAIQAGVAVDRGVYERGQQYLYASIEKELAKAKEQRWLGGLQTQACLAYALSLEGNLRADDANSAPQKWLAELYDRRGEMNNHGRVLLALAMHNLKKDDQAKTLLRNVLQFVERDDSNETAWVRTPDEYWWFWWNNDIETNARTLEALAAINPQNDLAPRLVKWLLNNRRHGYYWRSTRDTALVIAAMAGFMQATGEAAPDYTLTLNLDGQPVKTVKIDKTNFFTFDNKLLRSGLQVPPGAHQLTLTKTGPGALYYSAYLSYFTKEEDVTGAGNEIGIEREYFKLAPKTETAQLPNGRSETRAGFTRLPLKTGDAVQSGDLIEVVLHLTAKNTYDYLAFEDMKPAGCEPVELRSGGRWAGGLCANLELRDEKVVFFIGLLEQGRHVLRYKLRAETPGRFHVLPTNGFAMYAPEVKAISNEMRLQVKE